MTEVGEAPVYIDEEGYEEAEWNYLQLVRIYDATAPSPERDAILDAMETFENEVGGIGAGAAPGFWVRWNTKASMLLSKKP
jgi:hypothetical protein